LKILVIEDDADVVEAVSLCLQIRWPEVAISSSALGSRGVEMLKSQSFDVVILDLNLPDIDGLEVLRQVRSFSNIPIVILTVRGDEEDQTKGLEMGADDYIVKPFRARDFVARVNSVLRRTHAYSVNISEPTLVRGGLILNVTTDTVQFGGQAIKLTPRECRLLFVLMRNANQTLSSERLLKEIWAKEDDNTNLVTTYIRRLRDKLKDKPPRILLSERGEGYRFVSPV
jgi:DNA-binding response OmpR family regulator